MLRRRRHRHRTFVVNIPNIFDGWKHCCSYGLYFISRFISISLCEGELICNLSYVIDFKSFNTCDDDDGVCFGDFFLYSDCLAHRMRARGSPMKSTSVRTRVACLSVIWSCFNINWLCIFFLLCRLFTYCFQFFFVCSSKKEGMMCVGGINQ